MSKAVYFSKFVVTEQVFFKSVHSYALVNLKPLVPGHVLVVPLRTSIINMNDMSQGESQDYFQTLQLIQGFIKWYYKADSLNIAIQDGPEAGQSVPHLHAHIIPRYRLNNIGDQIYDKLDDWDYERDWNSRRQSYIHAGKRDGRRQLAKPDAQRIERSLEVMHKEAESLSYNLKEYMKMLE